MAVSVTINGTSYTIPQTADEGWGDNVTAWIQAASQYLLQRNGGTFALTADVDFGGTAGLKSKYFSTRSATPALTGVVRLSNAESIVWRDSTGLVDLALTVTNFDSLQFNGNSLLTSVGSLTANRVLNSDGTGAIASSSVTSTTLAFLDATSSIQTQLNAKQASLGVGTLNLPLVSNAPSTPTFQALSLTTGVAGTLQAAQMPALTGDITTTAGALATTAAATQANITTLSKSTGVAVHGTNTNTAASVGYIGEVVNAAAVHTFGAVATGENVASVSLTAGNWLVSGQGQFQAGSISASTSNILTITTTSGGSNPDGDNGMYTAPYVAGQAVSVAIVGKQFLLSSTTTVYLVAQVNCASGTSITCGGRITATRIS